MTPFIPFTLNISGFLKEFRKPAVMGIINVTDDSFFPDSRVADYDGIRTKALRFISEGADIIDIGACSTRPGSDPVSEETEIARIVSGVKAVREVSQDILISVDTYRASVAIAAVTAGADIINDISGGDLDNRMFESVAEMKVPYILMHTRGTPAQMSSLTDYGTRGVTATVLDSLAGKLDRLALLGVSDVIIDPGFGFAKTMEQNYELMRNLNVFGELGCPLLVGISRKKMLTAMLGIDASEALPATVALNCFAMERGASVIRVHDVREAVESVKIFSKIYDLC